MMPMNTGQMASGQAEGAPPPGPPSLAGGGRGEAHQTEVQFVLVGRNHGQRGVPLRVLAYLGETDDPERVMRGREGTYTDLHWERCTESYERVTLEDVKRERDR